MTPAERKAKQRRLAKKAGLCIVCAKAKKRRGRATCGPCNEAALERQRRLAKIKKSLNDT